MLLNGVQYDTSVIRGQFESVYSTNVKKTHRGWNSGLGMNWSREMARPQWSVTI
jgi:hypothetical protein